jgi:hypothetical protein
MPFTHFLPQQYLSSILSLALFIALLFVAFHNIVDGVPAIQICGARIAAHQMDTFNCGFLESD